MSGTQQTTSVIEDLPKTGLLRAKEIHRFFGIGLSTWWLWVKEGRAPKGIKLGYRTTVWRAEDIRTLLVTIGNKQSGDIGDE